MTWNKSQQNAPSGPRLVGILNITADSFSDGGDFFDPERAAEQAFLLIRDGADGLDLGAESTRPGSKPVPSEIQIERIRPVLRRIRDHIPAGFMISIDTRDATTADELLRDGANWINDVSALSDPNMPDVLAKHDAGVILTHMRGTPETMQSPDFLLYPDLLNDVRDALLRSAKTALAAGIPKQKILLDPGIGFSKNTRQNLTLIRNAPFFAKSGFQTYFGVSRKRFIGELTHINGPKDRDCATIGVLLALAVRHVDFLRVHNVAAARQALDLFGACGGISEGPPLPSDDVSSA